MHPRPLHYILVDRQAVAVSDVLEWASMFEDRDKRRVDLSPVGPDAHVSTVFLGLDHAFSGPPMIFETMSFVGGESVDCERCSTWDQAVAQHRRIVKRMLVEGEAQGA